MPELADFDRVLHVTGMTRTLRDALSGETGAARFARLPFVALPRTHPWHDGAPAGVGTVHHVTPTALGLVTGIDRVLHYVESVRRMWAPNGNPTTWEGDGSPAYLTAKRDDGELALEPLPFLVPCRLGYPGVLNLSVQLRPGRVLAPDEPLSVATRVAAQFLPVVVAAGNWGSAGAYDTLSPLAKLPWCISVGATADDDGNTLWEKSSVGGALELHAGQPERALGPTLVAPGENIYEPGTFGTSYAAPVAARQLGFLTTFLLQVSATQIRDDGQLSAVPLLVMPSVDRGFFEFPTAPKQPLPMLPSLGVDHDAARETIDTLRKAGCEADLDPGPAALRRLLVASARPMPAYDATQVGAGFVDDGTTLECLSSLTGADYAAAIWPAGGSALSESALARLRSLRLADPDDLGAALVLARDSALKYSVDFGSGRHFATTPEPAELARHAGVTREPDASFWPPPTPDPAG